MSLDTEIASGTHLGKDLSTLGTYEVSGEKVTGSLNYIEGWTEFSGAPDEQNGYYVALNVTPWDGYKFRVDRMTGKGKEVAFNGDGICICLLGKDEESAKTAKAITIISPEKEELSYDVTSLVLNKKSE